MLSVIPVRALFEGPVTLENAEEVVGLISATLDIRAFHWLSQHEVPHGHPSQTFSYRGLRLDSVRQASFSLGEAGHGIIELHCGDGFPAGTFPVGMGAPFSSGQDVPVNTSAMVWDDAIVIEYIDMGLRHTTQLVVIG